MTGKNPKIPSLGGGGLITNYNCPSKCAHCLYASSPNRKADFIKPAALEQIISQLKRRGISAIHIGGGEPLLYPEKLSEVLAVSRYYGMFIQYVETNSSWFRDIDSACRILEILMKKGLSTILVSISPFHNEYIPFYKTKGVIRACAKTGMGIFPWVEGFVSDLEKFDTGNTHDLSEFEEKLGPHYLEKIPGRYWITPRGRALYFLKPFLKELPLEEIIERNPRECRELYDTSHFHIDLYGNYIPGLCSGFSLPFTEISAPIDPERFPWLHTAITKGIRGIADFAGRELSFQPLSKHYVSKCELCQEIRYTAFIKYPGKYPDLAPPGFYREIIQSLLNH